MKVAACTMVRDEADHILEWVIFHHLIGFDELIVVDNNSSDRTYTLLESLTHQLPIRLVSYPSSQRNRQVALYEWVCRRYADQFEWIAFLDGDEFLVPAVPTTVKNMLRNLTDPVAVGWFIYGSNGHTAAPDGLVVENFLRRSPLGFGPNRHVKSIVRPSHVLAGLNPHVFTVDGRYTDVCGAPVEWVAPGLSQQPLANRPWRVNHYLTRSAEHWARRLARRQPGNNARSTGEFATYDRNEILDPVAARYAPMVNERMQRLLNPVMFQNVWPTQEIFVI